MNNLFTQACQIHQGLVEPKKLGTIPSLEVLNELINILNSSSPQWVNSSIQIKSYSTPWYFKTSLKWLQCENLNVDPFLNLKTFQTFSHNCKGTSICIGITIFSCISGKVRRRASHLTFGADKHCLTHSALIA